MALADASNTQLAFVEETTWGTTPASPSFQKVRMTAESLEYGIENVTSNEIRTDADLSDLIQVGASATGGFQFELSYGTDFDTLFEHALRGAFSSDILDAGTSKKSFTFEKKFEVGSPDAWFRFTGCRLGELTVNVRSQEIVTGSVSILGKGSSVATSQLAGATYSDANTNDVMAAPDVANITVGNVSASVYFTDLSFTLNNNLRAQNAVANLQAIGIGYGMRDVTGSMTAYFENTDLYEEFVNGTAGSLSFDVSDGTNTYNFAFHNIKYETGRVLAGGNNQDVFAEMSWRALYDSGNGTSVTITK